jgi:hypothetical protein
VQRLVRPFVEICPASVFQLALSPPQVFHVRIAENRIAEVLCDPPRLGGWEVGIYIVKEIWWRRASLLAGFLELRMEPTSGASGKAEALAALPQNRNPLAS